MKKIWTSIKSNRKILIFISTLMIIGIIFGIIYYFLQTQGIKEVISNELVSISKIIDSSKNNILFHFLIITIIFLLSFIIIGVPFVLFYLFYEAMSLGFLITIFTSNYGLKGLLFSLIFIICNKIVFLIILTYSSAISLKTSKSILKSFFLKANDTIYHLIRNNILKYCIIVLITLVNDLLVYFISSKILNLFLFLV